MTHELALTACPWQVSINHKAILLPTMVLSLITKHTVNHAFWEHTEHRLRVTLPFDSLCVTNCHEQLLAVNSSQVRWRKKSGVGTNIKNKIRKKSHNSSVPQLQLVLRFKPVFIATDCEWLVATVTSQLSSVVSWWLLNVKETQDKWLSCLFCTLLALSFPHLLSSWDPEVPPVPRSNWLLVFLIGKSRTN